jgi:transcriptional regulator with XRE-family HTH domain
LAASTPPLRVVPPESFGSRLRRQRRVDGLTQAKLGEQFGVQQQTIAAWEHDERPKSSFFGRLARYLGMNEKDLVSLIDSYPTLSLGDAEVSEAGKGSADQMMHRLAKSFMEAEKKGRLSPDLVEAYGKLFDYFGRRE